MIIYNPNNEDIIKKRLDNAEKLLSQIKSRYCFITGSFLYKKAYKDIDIFVITRSKKKIKVKDRKANITIIDFNSLHSLFYHSISKSCISKGFLPKKELKATVSDYWDVINEAIPTLLNQRNKYHKDVRSLILYIEYFSNGNILDSFQLDEKINKFKDYKEILNYVEKEVPESIFNKVNKSYLRRFFYTQAGIYRDLSMYEAQKFLYNLSHFVINRSLKHG